MTTAAEVAAELRQALDPVAFAGERLGMGLDPWQERALRTSSNRVLLNCSRQVGKSTVTSILALHTAMFRPRSLSLIFSKTKRQSGELLQKIYGFINTMERPPKTDKENDGELRLSTGSRILSLPGDGENTRAFSAPHLLVEDEAAFCLDSLYAAVVPMLATTNGRLWLLSSPNGKRGHFYEAWMSESTQWHRERITARESPRISEGTLLEMCELLGPNKFRQEFECAFVEADEQYFSDSAIMRAFSRDVPLLELAF